MNVRLCCSSFSLSLYLVSLSVGTFPLELALNKITIHVKLSRYLRVGTLKSEIGSRSTEIGTRKSELGSFRQEVEAGKVEVEIRKFELGAWMLEVGARKCQFEWLDMESRSWESGRRNSERRTQNLKLRSKKSIWDIELAL